MVYIVYRGSFISSCYEVDSVACNSRNNKLTCISLLFRWLCLVRSTVPQFQSFYYNRLVTYMYIYMYGCEYVYLYNYIISYALTIPTSVG